MQTSFPELFRPGEIGGVTLKNRIIKAPQHTGLANPDGSVTERMLRHYKSCAQGGPGLVIVEYAWVDEDASQASPCQLGIARMDHIPGLSLLAETIQANGAKAAVQISHAGRQRFTFQRPKAASAVPWEELYAAGAPAPQALTFDEVLGVVKAFGQAALRARMAGFDMVEIHACHGYLVSNFLSPRTNKRDDWYGGSLENRMRLLLEIVQEIRRQAGPDYPVITRLSGTDYEPDGHPLEETVELCRRLEALGVAAIHMSGGNHHQGIHTSSPMGMPRANNVWAAEAAKVAVCIPVVASGSLTDPVLAEGVIASGKADFVALARPLWADPEWPRKAQEGRPEDIRPCIRCNDGCLARGDQLARTVSCSVNVALCREDEYAITRVEHPKKVAVVGGGPAGMEAARVCALRGHRVTLYEKRELGGALLEAATPSFKTPDLQPLIDYLKTQVAKLQVEVLKEEATVTSLTSGGYDAVIVATGGTPLALDDVPGITHPKVAGAFQALHGEATVGQRVAVIGGGMVGTEVGLVLAEQGKQVVFVEMLDTFMNNVGENEKKVYGQRLENVDVAIHTGQRLEAVTDEGITVVDRCGRKTEIAVDSVVLAAGLCPNRALVEALRGQSGIEVFEAGDCVRPRKIFDAIHEGHLAAKLLD
jgi:2,4-dienoyl-CoA reductase-like NADH-dependent reductase (Old Yellow Enzyme family)/thioredoxin reductase